MEITKDPIRNALGRRYFWVPKRSRIEGHRWQWLRMRISPPSWWNFPWNFPCIKKNPTFLKLSWKISNFREGLAKPSHGNTSAQCLSWVMSHLMGSVTMRPWYWNHWLKVTTSLGPRRIWRMDSSKSEPMCCGVLDEYPEAAILLDQGIQAFILLFSLTMELTKSSSTYLWLLYQKRWISLNFFVALQFPQFSRNKCHLAKTCRLTPPTLKWPTSSKQGST